MHWWEPEKRTEGAQLSLILIKGAHSKVFAYLMDASGRKGGELLG